MNNEKLLQNTVDEFQKLPPESWPYFTKLFKGMIAFYDQKPTSAEIRRKVNELPEPIRSRTMGLPQQEHATVLIFDEHIKKHGLGTLPDQTREQALDRFIDKIEAEKGVYN
jgi:hypothetical protein